MVAHGAFLYTVYAVSCVQRRQSMSIPPSEFIYIYIYPFKGCAHVLSQPCLRRLLWNMQPSAAPSDVFHRSITWNTHTAHIFAIPYTPNIYSNRFRAHSCGSWGSQCNNKKRVCIWLFFTYSMMYPGMQILCFFVTPFCDQSACNTMCFAHSVGGIIHNRERIHMINLHGVEFNWKHKAKHLSLHGRGFDLQPTHDVQLMQMIAVICINTASGSIYLVYSYIDLQNRLQFETWSRSVV